jgi:hypothetical protein
MGTDFDDEDDGDDNDDDGDVAVGGRLLVAAAVEPVAPLCVRPVVLVMEGCVSGRCAPYVRCSSIQRRVGDARHAKPLTPATGSV